MAQWNFARYPLAGVEKILPIKLERHFGLISIEKVGAETSNRLHITSVMLENDFVVIDTCVDVPKLLNWSIAPFSLFFFYTS